MPMPWTLEYHPFGSAGETRPVKRRPDGTTEMATAEDVAIAEHVAGLDSIIAGANAANCVLGNQVHELLSKAAEGKPLNRPISEVAQHAGGGKRK